MKNDIRVKHSATLSKWVVTMRGKIVNSFDEVEQARLFKKQLQFDVSKERATNNISQSGLKSDIVKLESLASATVFKAKSLGHYTIDIDTASSSYWYTSKRFRDEDFKRLKRIVPNFAFID